MSVNNIKIDSTELNEILDNINSTNEDLRDNCNNIDIYYNNCDIEYLVEYADIIYKLNELLTRYSNLVNNNINTIKEIDTEFISLDTNMKNMMNGGNI